MEFRNGLSQEMSTYNNVYQPRNKQQQLIMIIAIIGIWLSWVALFYFYHYDYDYYYYHSCVCKFMQKYQPQPTANTRQYYTTFIFVVCLIMTIVVIFPQICRCRYMWEWKNLCQKNSFHLLGGAEVRLWMGNRSIRLGELCSWRFRFVLLQAFTSKSSCSVLVHVDWSALRTEKKPQNRRKKEDGCKRAFHHSGCTFLASMHSFMSMRWLSLLWCWLFHGLCNALRVFVIYGLILCSTKYYSHRPQLSLCTSHCTNILYKHSAILLLSQRPHEHITLYYWNVACIRIVYHCSLLCICTNINIYNFGLYL